MSYVYIQPKPFDPKTFHQPSLYMNVRVKKAKDFTFYAFYDSIIVFEGLLKVDVIHRDKLDEYIKGIV